MSSGKWRSFYLGISVLIAKSVFGEYGSIIISVSVVTKSSYCVICMTYIHHVIMLLFKIHVSYIHTCMQCKIIDKSYLDKVYLCTKVSHHRIHDNI